MAIAFPTPDRLDLTTSEQTFYTCPAATKIDNIHLLVTNYTDAVRLVTVYGVESGNSTSSKYAAAYQRPVPAKDTISVLVGRLEAADTITALADADSALNLAMASGTERN